MNEKELRKLVRETIISEAKRFDQKAYKQFELKMARLRDDQRSSRQELTSKIVNAIMDVLGSEFDYQEQVLYPAEDENYNEYFHDAVDGVWNLLYHKKSGKLQ